MKTFFPDDYQRLGQGSINQKQLPEQHKTHIIQKINEFGTYADLDVSEINEERTYSKKIYVASIFS